MEEDLFLIYVNNLGEDFEGKSVLEFIFSNIIKDVDGEDWDAIPSSSRPAPPYERFIKKIGVLESEVEFEFAQDSTCFCLWDAMDQIIALAYEDITSHTTYPDNRLVFHFGEPMMEVEGKLYERDLTLRYKK